MFIGAVAPCEANAQIGDPGPDSNFNELKVGKYKLPDPLTMKDGTRVRDAKTWMEHRRSEIIKLFEENEYGRSPGRPSDMSFEVFDKGTPAFNGAATRKQITIFLTADKKTVLSSTCYFTPRLTRISQCRFFSLWGSVPTPLPWMIWVCDRDLSGPRVISTFRRLHVRNPLAAYRLPAQAEHRSHDCLVKAMDGPPSTTKM